MIPVHPGEHVREYMEAHKLSVTALAERLGVTRPSASNLLNGHNGITAKMALRLERLFNRPARFWLMLQLNYDLELAILNEHALKPLKRRTDGRK